ncbi:MULTISPECIES: ParB/RepB/Spo0J family partition protein [unclassified Arthrobacter]|uniref:ParB/RepB/Spo0J family partition protein n=1 Tax=unclassified Arthrobacter TaxID=235627 RepID=UPI002DFD3A00|nr:MULTISPECIES: ParB/RepB/Spo0J family partition protein [unclassified Arthrobacter]MEC5190803.1 ParB family chromosome partitioning protein [Arthrobacter sp. MP_M4]MEC5204415.1 ParB family chromosome partitioning protein [Arthrobacter sp. MP_M7]
MSDKRRGLGRGLGALIPSSAAASASGTAPSRPVDLFFPEGRKRTPGVEAAAAEETVEASPADTVQVVQVPSEAQADRSPSVPTDAATRESAKKSTGRGTEMAKSESPATPSRAGAGADRPADPLPPVDRGVELVEVPGVRFAEIPVTDIHPNRKQPRSVFDEDDMAELVHSVREIGVLQPIVVRTSTEEGGEPYELVMGERRWRAVQAAGLETIPAIVRDTTDDDLLRDALLENLHRSQLNPLEEAAAYQQLLEDFGTTHEQLADRIGRSRPQVSNTLRLLKLPPLVQRRVAASVISAGHARALLALPDAAAMERLAQKIVAEGMSVRATEEAVTLYQNPSGTPKNNIPRPGARHERLDYLASSLSDRLDTNVKISLGARKGRVSIEFASVEDLNRIMDVLTSGPTS